MISAQKKQHRTHPRALNRSGNRLRESRSNPKHTQREHSAAPEFTRPQAVALLPRPSRRTPCMRRERSTAAPSTGSRTMAPRPPRHRPLKQRRAARHVFIVALGHLRAGGLAAPLAQTRRGAHDGDETKSCRVFE